MFLGASGVIFLSFLFHFFDECHVSKQNSPRWDAVFSGATFVAILFAYLPKKDARLICGIYLGIVLGFSYEPGHCLIIPTK